jgi:cobalt-precorrin-5B (C1)-methyltransferase
MRSETPEEGRKLRTGFTTGACATATSLAAARLLLTGEETHRVVVLLPRGKKACFALEYCRRFESGAEAGVHKDAGDDPDVTHGALVFARVSLSATQEVAFRAAAGVGTVTRDGLPVAVGEPAINPVPRRMMTEHLFRLGRECGYSGGFEVAVGVEDGAALAERTMNPRLGIVGGLSILGTTGIVRPFSCAAYVASIHQGIDVARANGITHIAACTGSTSEATAREQLGLPDMALVEMGDFAGAFLKHLRHRAFERVTLVGGFGKICKLAGGALDLHSRKSSVDFRWLSAEAATLGADEDLQRRILEANSSLQVLWLSRDAGIDLAQRVCHRAQAFALQTIRGVEPLAVWAIDREGTVVGHAGPGEP